MKIIYANCYYIWKQFRWLRALNISPASQEKQRAVAKTWHGEDWDVEPGPFFVETEIKGDFQIKATPWAYIQDLPSYINNLLDGLYR